MNEHDLNACGRVHNSLLLRPEISESEADPWFPAARLTNIAWHLLWSGVSGRKRSVPRRECLTVDKVPRVGPTMALRYFAFVDGRMDSE